MTVDVYERTVGVECRKSAAHHIANGKSHLPIEQRKEHEEKMLCEQMVERARAGEHFPSSLQTR
ncbi:MAG TPA: hypothetical protein VF221_00705 [Chloroflexota bacterium]